MSHCELMEWIGEHGPDMEDLTVSEAKLVDKINSFQIDELSPAQANMCERMRQRFMEQLKRN